MANNKFVFEDEVLLDLTGDDLTNDTSQVMSGLKYHGKDGVQYTGTGSAGANYEINITKPSNLSFNGTNLTWTASSLTVTVDTGWTYTSSLLYYIYVDDELFGTVSTTYVNLSNKLEREVNYDVKVKCVATVTISKVESKEKTSDSFELYIEAAATMENVLIKSAKLTTGLYGTSAVAIGNKAYIFGGFDSTSRNYIQEYDVETDTCILKSTTLAYCVYSTGAVAIGNKAYIFSGRESTGTDYIQEYDAETDTCSLKGTMDARADQAGAVEINGKIYIFLGGYGSIREYDPITETLSTKTATRSYSTKNFTITAVNKKAYTFGGVVGASNKNSIQEYDPTTDTCSTKSKAAFTCISGCAVSINGKAYIIGGSAKVQEYDPTEDSIKKISCNIEGSIEYASGVVINNKAYMFGGYNGTNNIDLIQMIY